MLQKRLIENLSLITHSEVSYMFNEENDNVVLGYLFLHIVFTFSGPLGLQNSQPLRGQSGAEPGARWPEGCSICHYLS